MRLFSWLLPVLIALPGVRASTPAQSGEQREPVRAAIEKPAPVAPELATRFDALHAEFSAAVAEHTRALEARKQAGDKSAPVPKRPHAGFSARYAELAGLGHPRAARWCLDFISECAASEEARRELYQACAAVVLPHVLHADQTQAPSDSALPGYDVADLLRSIRSTNVLLGDDKAIALCQELFEKAQLAESRAQALYAQAAIRLTRVQRDAPPPAEVLALYQRLGREYAATDTGRRAAGQLFRMERLQLGMVAPDFATEDVEGVAFKLGDYRGKVVVLDFWGFW